MVEVIYDENGELLSPLLRVPDVARILKVSHSHVYKLARQGKLRRLKDGARITYFYLKDVLSLAHLEQADCVSETSMG